MYVEPLDRITAGNVIDHRLYSPAPGMSLCTNCQALPSEFRSLGNFPAGTQLVFQLSDRSFNRTYLSTQSHARIEKISAREWHLFWDDAGSNDVPDGDFNDLIVRILLLGPGERYAGAGMYGHQNDSTYRRAEPVNTRTGNYLSTRLDFNLPGRGLGFEFLRTYNSSRSAVESPLGLGWTHSYAAHLIVNGDGSVHFVTEEGAVIPYTKSGTTFTGPAGTLSTLVAVTGGYQLTRRDQVVYAFNTSGQLTSLSDRNANRIAFTYTSGRLTGITDTVGRILSLTYDVNGHLTRLSGPPGRTVSYAYDASKRLASVTDAGGGVTRYTYDSASRLTSITDANGHVAVTNTYAADGRISAQVDARNLRTTFAWNATSLTSTMTDANGGAWIDDYSGIALASQRDPLGNTTTFTYDGSFNLTAMRDSLGNTTTFTYDSRANMLGSTAPAPLAYVTSATYNSRNDPLTVTDGRGNVTSFEYDADGNLVRVVQPGSVVTSLARDANGLVTSMTEPRGKVTTFAYDAQANLTAVTTPLGNRSSMAYDAAGRMTSTVDPRGNVTGANPASFTYDALDRLTSVTDPLGNDTAIAYDAVGNRTSLTDTLNRTTRWAYDATNHLTSVTDAAGGVTRYAYDAVGNLTARTDQLGRISRYAYDLAGRPTSSADPLGNTWSFAYDAAGRVTSRTDANRRTTSYAYDAIGRLTSIAYALNTTPRVTFAYDANGNRTSMTDGAGTESYTYDALNRLTRVARGADVFGYLYDEAGNVTRRTYPDGTQVGYSFDDDGRLTSLTSDGASTSYGYDASGNPITVGYPNGAQESRTYDRAGRLTEISHAAAGRILAELSYTLDPVGNVLEERNQRPEQVGFTVPDSFAVPDGQTVIQDGDQVTVSLPPLEVTSYDYDTLDRLTEACFDETCADYIRYTYDRVGNRLSETRPTWRIDWTYDAADRIVAESGPQRVAAAQGRLDESVPPERRFVYDANGNQLSDGQSTYTYDLADRMASATAGLTTQTYRYAGDGRRLSATTGAALPDAPDDPVGPIPEPEPTPPPPLDCLDDLDTCPWRACGRPPCLSDLVPNAPPLPSASPAPSVPPEVQEQKDYVQERADYYLTCAREDRLLDPECGPFPADLADASQSGAGESGAAAGPVDVGIPEAPSTAVTVEYDWDLNAALPLLALEREDGGTLLHRYAYGLELTSITGTQGTAYYHHDRLGSPRLLTSETGAPQAAYRYEPFGVPRYAADATAPPNPMLLNGQYLDMPTGLYHLRARQYDPTLGRFLSRDPVAADIMAPCESTYAYARDNPLRYVDPAGLAAEGASGTTAARETFCPEAMFAGAFALEQLGVIHSAVSYLAVRAAPYLIAEILVVAAEVGALYLTGLMLELIAQGSTRPCDEIAVSANPFEWEFWGLWTPP